MNTWTFPNVSQVQLEPVDHTEDPEIPSQNHRQQRVCGNQISLQTNTIGRGNSQNAGNQAIIGHRIEVFT
jgi:hypothetical protein